MRRNLLVLCATAVLLASCSEDVVGVGPARGDIVDYRRVNVFQVSGAGPTTHRPECDDGRCVDVLLRAPVCPATIDQRDFSVTALNTATGRIVQLCGVDAFDSVMFSNATSRRFTDLALLDPLTPTCGPRLAEANDTVTLHFKSTAFAELLSGADFGSGPVEILVGVRSPQVGTCGPVRAQIVVETITPNPDPLPQPCDGPVCPPSPPSFRVTLALRPVLSGLATVFAIDDESLGAPPVLVETSLRDRLSTVDGKLEAGTCPASVCGASGPTRWFPPHGQMSGRFDASAATRPATFGILTEVGGATYRSVADLEARGAPIRVLDPLGSTYSPSASSTFFIVAAAGAPLPLGLHIANLEITNDATLLALGDPLRLLLPPVTQSSHGIAFSRGGAEAADGIGPITISLVRFDEAALELRTGVEAVIGGTVALDPVTHAPLATRVTVGVPDLPGLDAVVDGTGRFAARFTVDAARSTPFSPLHARAYADAGQFLGYDEIPFRMLGTITDDDADGVDDAVDNCLGLYNPDQMDLNTSTPRQGFFCEVTDDRDGDGVSDLAENLRGTSSVMADSDGDGVSDGDERSGGVLGAALDPRLADTDGDGVLDGDELADGAASPLADGIPDGVDPDNTTIGVDPAPSIFLVDERWTTDFSAGAVPDSAPDTTATWRVEGTVSFTLKYALIVESGAAIENWLTTDPAKPSIPAAEEDSPGYLRVARVVRLDALGLPYMTDVEIRTNRCEQLLGGRIGGHACELVPVALFRDVEAGELTPSLLVPRGDGEAQIQGGGEASFTIHEYPIEGYDCPLGPRGAFCVRGEPFPLVRFEGMGAISPAFGGAAHYGGRDEDDRTVTRNFGTKLLVSSLRSNGTGSVVDNIEGLSIAACIRPTSLDFSVGRDRTGECVPATMVGNLGIVNAHGMRLDFFGELVRRGTDVPAAAYGVPLTDPRGSAQLVSLLRGERAEATGTQRFDADGDRHGHSFEGVGFATLTREVAWAIRALHLVFVDGDLRDVSTGAVVDSPPWPGTDSMWSGRFGYTALTNADPGRREASSGLSRDWFRAHVVLPRPTGRGPFVERVDRIVRACPAARARDPLECRPHLRVQVESERAPLRAFAVTDALGAQDAVVLSQSVPFEELLGAVAGRAATDGIRLRWTGQRETARTLNTIADGSHTGTITGCVAFPGTDAINNARDAHDTALAGSVVHPGPYVLRGRLVDARGLADAGVSCIFPTPTVRVSPIPGRASAGRRKPISVRYPVALRDMTAGGMILAMGPELAGEDAGAIHEGMYREVEEFYGEVGAALDVFRVAGAGFGAPDVHALPPFAVLNFGYTPADDDNCDRVVGGIERPEVGGLVDLDAVLRRRPALALGCVHVRLVQEDGTVGIARLAARVCEGAQHSTAVPGGNCQLVRALYLDGLPRPWSAADAESVGRALGSFAGVHELGHLLGLSHVLLGGVHVDASGRFISGADIAVCPPRPPPPTITVLPPPDRCSVLELPPFPQALVGPGTSIHPMLSRAHPPTLTPPQACFSVAVGGLLNENQFLPLARWRSATGVSRAASMLEPAGSMFGRWDATAVLCAGLRRPWYTQAAPSLPYVRAQFPVR